MSKPITRDEAVERLMHHLRGHLLDAMVKEYREPYQLSLFLKAKTAALMQQIRDVLDVYKPPEPPPVTTKK